MQPGSFKKSLADGEVLIGCMFCEFFTPGTCLMARSAGFDFIIIDTEHNRPGIEAISWVLRAGRDIDYPVIVRAPAFEGQWPSRYLDLGAAGLMYPRVDFPEEAQRIMRLVKYPPEGRRGIGLFTGHDDYSPGPVVEFINSANSDLIHVVQLETVEGWENREAILDVPGVDVCFIGPNDLALNLGVPGQFDHPQVQAAIDDILAAAEARGIAGGMFCATVEEAAHWRDRGFRFLVLGTEALVFVQAGRAAMKQLRS